MTPVNANVDSDLEKTFGRVLAKDVWKERREEILKNRGW